MSKKLPLCGTTQFIKLLQYDGFSLKKRSKRGSHTTYVKSRTKDSLHLVVVVQLNKNQYPTGLLRSMIKQAGWSRNRYIELLNEI